MKWWVWRFGLAAMVCDGGTVGRCGEGWVELWLSGDGKLTGWLMMVFVAV
jgi:hypothetical protein